MYWPIFFRVDALFPVTLKDIGKLNHNRTEQILNYVQNFWDMVYLQICQNFCVGTKSLGYLVLYWEIV